ncbi:MAG: DUF1501 domain-containing protein [Proteobacteria bacterium]|nr:DUF1501 domain-containing protein [Pseudomonadota bacterium]
MEPNLPSLPQHVRFSRRAAIQAGAIGLLNLGMNHVDGLRALAAPGEAAQSAAAKAKAVIYIFLSGGLGQHDSFDMKPDAPDTIRGEFKPIATRTPGIQICEHLPRLADRSQMWALVRSLAHPYPEHSAGHLLMLTGRSQLPVGFDPSKPKAVDWPSMAAIANAVCPPLNNVPPAVVLPEILIHREGRVIPGQFAGEMGSHRNPMFVTYSRFNAQSYGAWPEYGFHHARGGENPKGFSFQAPNLTLPSGIDAARFNERLDLLGAIGSQQAALERVAENEPFDRYRQKAISLLADRETQRAFNVADADPKLLDRYGRNTFGWSLLIARQLVEAGVSMIQVNLGNDETWDTHGNAFPHLKDYLFPPTDRAVSALLDDLAERGLLDSTLVVMAGEMGRTPKISTLPQFYAKPGRDHWGTQTVFFAGGGVRGGTVIGSTDKIGAYPAANPQKPENMAATIYQALGIPRTLAWHDSTGRPHFVYHGDPIAGLT